MHLDPAAPDSLSRRDFVARLALAGAALPLATATAQAQAEKKKSGGAPKALAKPTKLGTIHVFAKPLQFLSYEETAAMAKAAGYGGIDYAVRPGGHVVPEKVQDDLPRAVEAAQKAGLKVEMITTGITTVKDKFTEPVLRTAAKLGIKVYRFGNFAYDESTGVMGSLAKTRQEIKELAALNQSLGLHGAIQNHAGARVGGPVWDLYEVLRESDPRWAGVQYDIRHAIVEGAQSWSLGLKLVAPWVRCIDIKDFKWDQAPGRATVENVPLGEGIVPFPAFFDLVAKLNIAGPISMHLEYPPFERSPMSEAEKRRVLPGLMQKDLAYLRRFLA